MRIHMQQHGRRCRPAWVHADADSAKPLPLYAASRSLACSQGSTLTRVRRHGERNRDQEGHQGKEVQQAAHEGSYAGCGCSSSCRYRCWEALEAGCCCAVGPELRPWAHDHASHHLPCGWVRQRHNAGVVVGHLQALAGVEKNQGMSWRGLGLRLGKVMHSSATCAPTRQQGHSM